MSWKNKVVPDQNVPTKPGRLRESRREHKRKKRKHQEEKKMGQKLVVPVHSVPTKPGRLKSTVSWKNKVMHSQSASCSSSECSDKARPFQRIVKRTQAEKRKQQEEDKTGQKLVVPVQNVPTKPGRLRELCKEHKWEKKEISRREQDESELNQPCLGKTK
ncbi:hypothetical protein DFJ73DRAFT_769320 [Zopfochytrium polystomum]|nr:hypothetical protein DFJ73DRAFT_769320 [Zopfochytrium polystomum]